MAVPPNESPTRVPLDVGRKVGVVANLLLTPSATPASTSATRALATALGSWQGAGVLVLAGNLFDARAAWPARQLPDHPGEDQHHAADGESGGPAGDSGSGGPAGFVRAALAAHHELAASMEEFAGGCDRRVIWIPGEHDAEVASVEAVGHQLESMGVRIEPSVDLALTTATGERLVRIEGGRRLSIPEHPEPGRRDLLVHLPVGGGLTAEEIDRSSRPWSEGMDHLADPASLHRFLTSRLLYRRMARYAWWLLLPFAAAVVLRFPFLVGLLDRLFASHPTPHRLIAQAGQAGWADRLAAAGLIALAELLVLLGVLAVISRKAWSALGGGRLPGLLDQQIPGYNSANDAGRDFARELLGQGYTGLISGYSLQAELTHLGTTRHGEGPGVNGFFASPGVAGYLVEERPGRLGLPPVFLESRQTSWVELETGADLHIRLFLARSDEPSTSLLERVAARGEAAHDSFPTMVAAHPSGASWPPPPDLGALKRRSRRVRRVASAAIGLAGLADLASALQPPLRSHLHLVEQVLPLGATQAAGALVALGAIGLLALARGVRRGQKRAWAIAVGLLALTLVLHLAHGGDTLGTLVTLGVLLVLLAERSQFAAASDRTSLRSALLTLLLGAVGTTVIATTIIELGVHLPRRHQPTSLGLFQAIEAVLSRMVGIQEIGLPDRLEDFLSPSLLAVGIALAFIAVILATRPVVDRRRSSGKAAEIRARDIVNRHGAGTLDYFALRADKRWFFHRDTLVAYAIYGGVCLVSPDPIGPASERAQAWNAFRRFAESQSWIVALMGAGEEWLPLYRMTGMHDIYIGDEAVVDIQSFSLAGKHMKGLRQAHNRIARYGYSVSFHDPAVLDAPTAAELATLMAKSRRGDEERGFSMMLGRIFDPRDHGLLLAVVRDPEGTPVAMCQFVPAPGIGGYSLDLMRRDTGDHPNGLIDFALVSTIEHLAGQGARGLSLNFAAMRSVLDGERGDGIAQRAERWALRKMSGFLQIESLWRFNAKYDPDWLSRYVVYDAPEHLVAVTLAILRAESLSDVPVVGRLLAPSRSKRAGDLAPAEADRTATGGEAPGGEAPSQDPVLSG